MKSVFSCLLILLLVGCAAVPCYSGSSVLVKGSNSQRALSTKTTLGPSIFSNGGWQDPATTSAISQPELVKAANLNWPMFHHDLEHTGYSTSPAPKTNQTLWEYQTGGYVYSSPSVAGGNVFVSSTDGNVYALNATTGTRVWNYTVGNILDSSPAIADGVVYVGSLANKFYALNATSGTLKWSYTTRYWVDSSPVVADGVVYLGQDVGEVDALNASTGTLVWSYTTGNGVFSSPAVVGGVVYLGSGDGKVYALNATSGGLKWSYATGGWVDSSCAIAGGVVFIGSENGWVYALNVSTGTLVWKYLTTSLGVWSSPAVAYGVVYVGSWYGTLYALNATTGALEWSYKTGASVNSSPAVANGVVYVGSNDGKVYALNASTGAVVWSYETGKQVLSSPAVAGGVIFVGSANGGVYAFGVLPLSTSIMPSHAVLNIGQSSLFISSVTGGTSPYSYQWYLNGTAVSGATSPSWNFTPSFTAAYSVYLEVDDSVGIKATSNTASVFVGYLLQLSADAGVRDPTFTITGKGLEKTYLRSVGTVLRPGTYQITVNLTFNEYVCKTEGVTSCAIWQFNCWSPINNTSATIQVTLNTSTVLVAVYSYHYYSGAAPV